MAHVPRNGNVSEKAERSAVMKWAGSTGCRPSCPYPDETGEGDQTGCVTIRRDRGWAWERDPDHDRQT